MKGKFISLILLPFLYVLLVVIPFGFDLFFEKDISCEKTCLFVVFLAIAIVANVVSHCTGKIERGQNDLSTEILKSECKVTLDRYNMIYESFKEKILSNENNYNLNYDPSEKIASILNSLSECFEKYLNVKSSYVSVAVFYRFEYQNEDEWKRLDKDYYPAFESNPAVMLEPDSFGKFLNEDGTEDFYLLNDKYREGIKKNRYKLNNKDIETRKRYHRYGSIIGAKILVKVGEHEHIRAILTLSTYGKKIDSVPFGLFRENIENKIEKYILPLSLINVKSELIQLYLEKKMKRLNHLPESEVNAQGNGGDSP